MRRKIAFFLFFIIMAFNNKLVLAQNIEKYMEVSVENNEIKEETEYIKANLSIPRIKIKDNNELGDKITERINNDILTWRSDLTELAHQYKSDYSKDNITFHQFELITKYELTYNKNNILSIPVIYYQYTGGAHGLATKIPYNIDLNTGEQIKLNQLFKEGLDYTIKINKYIKEEITKHPEQYFNNGEDFKGIKEKQDFYIANDGIVVYFQVYEIAPYSSGIREFKIPFSLIQSDLKYKLD